MVLVALLGGAAWYFFLGPGVPLRESLFVSATEDAGRPVTLTASESLMVRLDRLGDSLGQSIRHYRDRARLFDDRKIDCAALAPGLVAVENILIAYSRGRAGVAATAMDAMHQLRDQALTAATDSVERHFDRSGCPRP